MDAPSIIMGSDATESTPLLPRHSEHAASTRSMDATTRTTASRWWKWCLQRIFFNEGGTLVAISATRRIEPHDLLVLPRENRSKRCVSDLMAAGMQTRTSADTSGSPLLRTLLATYATTLLWCSLGQVFQAACEVLAPIVVREVVLAFSSTSSSSSSMTLSSWLTIFFATRVLTILFETHLYYALQHMVLRLMAALRSLLFQKAMRRPLYAPPEAAARVALPNLITSDASTVVNAVGQLTFVWILPLHILAITYLLYEVLDIAAFAGIAVIVAALTLNTVIARIMARAYSSLMRVKDARMRTVTQVFGAIQHVKFNAWERRCEQQLGAQRRQELVHLTRYCYTAAANAFVLWSSPLLVSSVSFAVYALVLQRELTPATVFTSMALFNALRAPLKRLPRTLQDLIQSRVSLQRLQQYLDLPERDESAVVRKSSISAARATASARPNSCRLGNDDGDVVIRVVHGTFDWSRPIGDQSLSVIGEQDSTLVNIDLKIHRGNLVVITGDVGAGKSSLLAALLGEMHGADRGSVSIAGSLAYYAQSPWIQHLTVRDNILFGHAFDAARYAAVLDACCLNDDLALFPAGDRTEIGEKGINLSGGQRARLALARACYADADVYLLDSPLAAVDAIVQKQLIDRCLCGLLAHKTVLLVTHQRELIESDIVDHRIVLTNGRVTSDSHLEREDCTATSRRVAQSRPVHQENVNVEVDPGASEFVEERVIKASDRDCGALVAEEKRNDGDVHVSVWKRYVDAIGGMPLLKVLVVTQLLWQCFQIGSDVWLSRVVSRNDAEDAATSIHHNASHTIEVYVALASASALMVLVQGVVVSAMGLRASATLFFKMVHALLAAPLRFFDRNPIGRILIRFTDDFTVIDRSIPTAIGLFISEAFSTTGALLTAALSIQWLSVFLVPLVVLYLHWARGYVRAFCEVQRLRKVCLSPILSHVTQCEQGVATLRAFGAPYTARAIIQMETTVDQNSTLWHSEIVIIQWFMQRIKFLECALLGVVLCAMLSFRDWFSPGLVGLVFTYALNIDNSLIALVRVWSRSENCMVSVERVLEYGDLEPEEDPTQAEEAASRMTTEAWASWPSQGTLTFEKVSFGYDRKGFSHTDHSRGLAPAAGGNITDGLVLHNVSFTIRAGEKVGIVGRTGAGKSSLAMALFRINALARGRIMIDGLDIARVPLGVLRAQLSIIPQSPVLLEGSVRDFLDPFGDHGDGALLRVLVNVELAQVLAACCSTSSDSKETMAHTRGVLDVELRANGDNLSVGERQMLCMARALLKNTRIVLMDEATASIDHATERRLAAMIHRELERTTVLTIAHRLRTVVDSDRILVLRDGRVVEWDAPDALLAKEEGGYFAALMRDAQVDATAAGTTDPASA